MIGQNELIQNIDNLIINKKFPHSIILEGKKGCGKHTLINYIADKLNLSIIDLTNKIEQQILDEIALSPSTTIYTINGDKITTKQQNMLLKTLEDNELNYFILVCELVNIFIPTIINRCQIFEFAPYTKETLNQFTDSELILEYAETPGIVEELKLINISDVIDLCYKIFDKIKIASYSNIFVIPEKLWYNKYEEDKVSFDIFIELLGKVAFNLYCQSKISFQVYSLTSSLYNNSKIPNINKKMLFEEFIVQLKMSLT